MKVKILFPFKVCFLKFSIVKKNYVHLLFVVDSISRYYGLRRCFWLKTAIRPSGAIRIGASWSPFIGPILFRSLLDEAFLGKNPSVQWRAAPACPNQCFFSLDLSGMLSISRCGQLHCTHRPLLWLPLLVLHWLVLTLVWPGPHCSCLYPLSYVSVMAGIQSAFAEFY